MQRRGQSRIIYWRLDYRRCVFISVCGVDHFVIGNYILLYVIVGGYENEEMGEELVFVYGRY